MNHSIVTAMALALSSRYGFPIHRNHHSGSNDCPICGKKLNGRIALKQHRKDAHKIAEGGGKK